MEQDRLEPAVQPETHLVVLVHGIRTRAAWYSDVQEILRKEGFEVALTNYGRFGLLRFLLPIPFFKAWAATDLERNIREAMDHYKVDRIIGDRS